MVPVARGRARRHLAPTLRAFCEYIYGADGRRSLLLKHIKGWDAISAIICPVPTNIRKFGNPCVRQEIKLDCGERGKKRTLTKILNKRNEIRNRNYGIRTRELRLLSGISCWMETVSDWCLSHVCSASYPSINTVF